MNAIFNIDKITDLLVSYYKLTHIVFSFCDSSCKMITSSDIPVAFCGKISGAFPHKCKYSDTTNLINTSQLKKPYFYTCHAGMIESIFPILHNNIVIAHVIAGQFRDKSEKYSSEKDMLARTADYGLNENDLINSYRCAPILSESEITSLTTIVNSIISTMWQDKLISIDDEEFVLKINDYIEENIKNPISVEELCRAFYLSKNTMYKLFKRNFNESITLHILSKRLERAQHLLKETSNSVSYIAEECGFSDYNYFTRIFRQHLGIPPLKFRKIHKEKVLDPKSL